MIMQAIPTYKANSCTDLYFSCNGTDFYSVPEIEQSVAISGLDFKDSLAAAHYAAGIVCPGHIIKFYVSINMPQPYRASVALKHRRKHQTNDCLALSALCGFILRLFKFK